MAGTTLRATVVPGVTLTDESTIDPDTINKAARPTIDISGTIDGQQVDLGELVVREQNLDNDCIMSRHIQDDQITSDHIADGQITAAHLAVGVGGVGAGDIGHAELSSDCITGQDPKTNFAAADSFLLSDSAASGALKEGLIGDLFRVYRSAAGALTGSSAAVQIVSAAHGLGGTPDLVQVLLVCTAENNGYVVGDVMDPGNLVLHQAGYYTGCPVPFQVWADATNIILRSWVPVETNDVYVHVDGINKSGSAFEQTWASFYGKWNAKLVAMRFGCR